MKEAIATAIILLVIQACGTLENRVMVTNDTVSEITGIEISVCDSSWSIETLAPGETITFTAVYATDGHFQVSSPELNGDFGYVTHGITGDEAEITFREDRIDFRQSTSSY